EPPPVAGAPCGTPTASGIPSDWPVSCCRPVPSGCPLPSGWPPLPDPPEPDCDWAGPCATLIVRPTGAGLVPIVQAITTGTGAETPVGFTANLIVNVSGVRIWSVPALVRLRCPEARTTGLMRSLIAVDRAIFPGCAPCTARSAAKLGDVAADGYAPVPAARVTVSVLP